MQYPRLRIVFLVVVLFLAALAFASRVQGAGLAVPGGAASYLLLMLLPGLSIYFCVEKKPAALEALLYSTAVTPVFTTIVSVLSMTAGWSPGDTVLAGLAVSCLVGAGAVVCVRPLENLLTRKQWLILGGTVLVLLFLIGYLPLTNEWWRFRSDAWFHRAVVAQINDFGLPPEDPYFAGYELQYMWFYHVLIVVLSRATGLDPFMIPPLLNLQAFCGFVIATVLLAGVFRRRFSYRFASTLTVLLAFNGFFWLFLPIKAARVFLGDVQGMSEIIRQFSLWPLDRSRAVGFLTIYYNQDFLLDKFVVATSLSIALCCMAAFWYGTSGYVARHRFSFVVLVFFMLLSMLGFHPLVGFVMFIGLFGAMVLLFLIRSRVVGYSLKVSLVLSGACLLALLLISPYLYAIMHLKETEQLIPIDFSFNKIAGIIITCAAVLFLVVFQRNFFKKNGAAERYLHLATLVVVVFCLLIKLPGPNTFDKLPIFIFFPLAVIGGWSFVDYLNRQPSRGRKTLAVVLIGLLFLVPANAITFAGYFCQPTERMYTEDEEHLALWVREHTARESVYIARDKEVFMLVAGPRRYYCGYMAYALFWGYDKSEMAARARVRDTIYGSNQLDAGILRPLGEVKEDLYVIAHQEDGQQNAKNALVLYPEFFTKVYTAGKLLLYKVDTEACRRAAAGPAPDHSEEE